MQRGSESLKEEASRPAWKSQGRRQFRGAAACLQIYSEGVHQLGGGVGEDIHNEGTQMRHRGESKPAAFREQHAWLEGRKEEHGGSRCSPTGRGNIRVL